MCTTPCDHHFCYDCIKAWLQTSSTCPSCRGQLYQEEDKEVSAKYDEEDEAADDSYDFTPDDLARLEKILDDFSHGRGRSGAHGTTLMVKRWDKETWRPYEDLYVRLQRSGVDGGWVFWCDENGEMRLKQDRVQELLRYEMELHCSLEWAAEVC